MSFFVLKYMDWRREDGESDHQFDYGEITL